jgi:cobyrinic acid a,c-diamide synthase
VFNRVGRSTHLEYLREAVTDSVKMPFLGGLPREPRLELPGRHLGLVTSDENPLPPDYVDRLADLMEKSIDLDTILGNLPDVPEKASEKHQDPGELYPVRIGVARDEAFCFYYQDNLEILESFGAELVFFSPLRDERLPEEISGLYLGGGYPELFAWRLSNNVSLRTEIKGLTERDFPVYAECGGLMFLCQGIENDDGIFYPMVGLYPFAVRMLGRLKSLGYREVSLAASCPLGAPGLTIRGHEFHYSEMIDESAGVKFAYTIANRAGKDAHREGFLIHNTLGSYVHLHFGSNPDVAKNFVSLCWKHR